MVNMIFMLLFAYFVLTIVTPTFLSLILQPDILNSVGTLRSFLACIVVALIDICAITILYSPSARRLFNALRMPLSICKRISLLSLRMDAVNFSASCQLFFTMFQLIFTGICLSIIRVPLIKSFITFPVLFFVIKIINLHKCLMLLFMCLNILLAFYANTLFTLLSVKEKEGVGIWLFLFTGRTNTCRRICIIRLSYAHLACSAKLGRVLSLRGKVLSSSRKELFAFGTLLQRGILRYDVIHDKAYSLSSRQGMLRASLWQHIITSSLYHKPAPQATLYLFLLS